MNDRFVKIPLVKSKYPEDVQWVCFHKIARWGYPYIQSFAYDWISNKYIDRMNNHPLLLKTDLSKDWQDDIFDITDPSLFPPDYIQYPTIRMDYHPLRVRAIIEHLINRGWIAPITLDTYSNRSCPNCISDGHHRIRALQYLGYTHFPAYCSGLINEIERIIDKDIINYG